MEATIETSEVMHMGLLNIARMYVRTWMASEDGRQLVIRMISTIASVRSIFCMIYGILKKSHGIGDIENLPADLLDELETEALTWDPAATGNTLTQLMKSIWTMNNPINHL